MAYKHAIGPVMRLVLTALIAAGAAGCAEKGPILLDVAYQAPADKILPAGKLSVAVSPFLDRRDAAGPLLGSRTVADGMKNDLVTSGTVAGLVTEKLKDALRARGAVVKNGGAWNLQADTMPSTGAPLVISGSIKAFWLESVSVPFKTTMKTAVQLTIVAGDGAEKKIIRTLDVSSINEQETLYSDEKLNSLLSEALSAALDQIFQDDVIRKKLQERR